MVDWSTVLIAAISAGAGLGGSVIAGHFNLRVVTKSHRRDDVALIRAKVEELYAELDYVQNLSNVSAAGAMAAINAQAAPQEKFDTINLGKIRSIVGLYFPTCQTAIGAFDQQAAENAKTLRVDLEEKKLNPLTAGFSYLLLECQSRTRMCGELRELLDKQADVIGKSVRDGLVASLRGWMR